MKVYNNEIKCQRGETFQLNRTFLNEDETPFIIPSELHDPYFLVTVASVSQMTENRYLRNFWLSLEPEYNTDDSSYSPTIDEFLSAGGVPRFDETAVVDLSKITESAGEISGENPALYPSWDSVGINDDLGGYIGDDPVTFPLSSLDYPYYKECVFVNKKSVNDTTYVYKYYCKTSNSYEWREYSMDFSFPFTRDVTREWISQKYLYGISLVAGSSTREEVEEFCRNGGIIYADVDQLYDIGEDGIMAIIKEGDTEIKEFRDALVSYDSNLYHCFAEGIPLNNFDFVQVILNPTALYVSTDLKGGMLNG